LIAARRIVISVAERTLTVAADSVVRQTYSPASPQLGDLFERAARTPSFATLLT
jgi:hypothetical protein